MGIFEDEDKRRDLIEGIKDNASNFVDTYSDRLESLSEMVSMLQMKWEIADAQDITIEALRRCARFEGISDVGLERNPFIISAPTVFAGELIPLPISIDKIEPSFSMLDFIAQLRVYLGLDNSSLSIFSFDPRIIANEIIEVLKKETGRADWPDEKFPFPEQG